MKQLSLSCLVLPIFFVCFSLHAQVPDLFTQTEPLEIHLRADWDQFIADRSDTAAYLRAQLSYLEVGRQQVLPVEVKVRGNFRRRADICDFPPIHLKIKKKIARGTIFEGSKRLKMVTHCKEEVLVLREYLVYRLYQLLVGDGFRVRLAKVNYIDKYTDRIRESRFAFFIESEKMLEKRLGGELLEEIVSKNVLHREDLTRLMIFQYMMGNKDWSAVMSKNIRLLQREGEDKLRPVPYDFDWTGIVGATYTGMEENFDWRTPPPYCRTPEEYDPWITQMLAKEKECYALLRQFPHLTREESRHMLQYLRKSFRLIKNSETIETVFQESCKREEQGG